MNRGLDWSTYETISFKTTKCYKYSKKNNKYKAEFLILQKQACSVDCRFTETLLEQKSQNVWLNIEMLQTEIDTKTNLKNVIQVQKRIYKLIMECLLAHFEYG